jgi:ABC-2 type transport system permease protein
MAFKRSLAVIGEIVRKEFHQIRQDRRMLGISIAAPVVQVILLGYAATTDIKNTTMAVCDQDRTAESRNFVQSFTSSGYFILGYSADAPAEVEKLIAEGRAAIALVIPRGFASTLLAKRTTVVQVLLDGTDANSSSIRLNYATQIATTYAQNLLLEQSAMMKTIASARLLPEPRVWFNPDLKSSNFMVPGVVGMVLMLITMMLTSLGIVREKEDGTMEQLLVTPIKPHELILGKLIPFTVIGFLDVVIVLALARYWFAVPMLGSIPLLFGLSLLFILTTLGLGLFISTIARTQQQAMLIAAFFFFMPFMYLSGFAFPIANMPESIQLITYLIPLRYFLEIVRGIFLKGAGIGELWPQAAALLGLGVLIFALSVLRFQKKLE